MPYVLVPAVDVCRQLFVVGTSVVCIDGVTGVAVRRQAGEPTTENWLTLCYGAAAAIDVCRREAVCTAVAGEFGFDCGAYDCIPVAQTCPRNATAGGSNRSKKGLLGLLGLVGLIPLACVGVVLCLKLCKTPQQQVAVPTYSAYEMSTVVAPVTVDGATYVAYAAPCAQECAATAMPCGQFGAPQLLL